MIEIIELEELLNDSCPEGISCAPGRERELVPAVVRVRPHEISHGSLVWYFPEPVYDFDLVDGMYAWA